MEAIAGRFGAHSEAIRQLRRVLHKQSQRLRVTWEGEGAAVFNTEMERAVPPAIRRRCDAPDGRVPWKGTLVSNTVTFTIEP